MNKGITFILGLTIGAAGGSIVTWKLLKNKYELLAREEVNEVREYYASKTENVETTSDGPNEPDEEDEEEPSKEVVRTEYSAIASIYAKNDEKEGGDIPMRREPYVISPSEFGEDDKYESETLYYYNDGVLADREGNRIEDIESCIGYESLNHFGEFTDDDSVYVRNDDSMMEYEVLLDESNYADLDGID
jgi:hypothetical protein